MIFKNSVSNGLAFPQKVKHELPYDPIKQFLSIHLKRLNTGKTDIFTPMFIGALFTIAKRWKNPSFHEWMNV